MQTDNINFQDIWNKKSAEIPNIKEIKSTADKYKKKQLQSTLWHIFSLSFTACMIIFIWNIIDFKMVTTTLGIILILIALALYIYLFSQNVNVIRKINPSISNQEYLASLKKLQRQQLYMQTNGIGIYYILLTAGFAFYFYEFALRMSTLGGVLAYGLTFFWLAIVWFFIRPKQVRKQNEKISKVIDSLELIEKDLNN
jgi:tryptophan-rich sensory protein